MPEPTQQERDAWNAVKRAWDIRVKELYRTKKDLLLEIERGYNRLDNLHELPEFSHARWSKEDLIGSILRHEFPDLYKKPLEG